jgi:glyoxylase-like metal-dependent hydrolase (beta-lactamase superfamily II)
MRPFALVILAAGVLAGKASAQNRDFSKVEIKTIKVAGAISMLQGAGGNIAVSAGDDGVAMIDDEFAPLSEKIHAAIRKLSPKPVRFLINTHWHGDHTGGNAQFSDTATILASANVRKRLMSGGEISAVKMKIDPAPSAALPVVTFDEGLSLWWNGEEIKAIRLPPGHTDGDTVVWFKKSNVVHLGDDFVTYGFPFVDLGSGGSVTGMLKALDIILGQIPQDAKIIPGHGDVSTVADVRKFRSSLEEMVQTVKKGLAAGKTVTQLQQEKVLAPWASWGPDNAFVKADAFIATIADDLKRNPQ